MNATPPTGIAQALNDLDALLKLDRNDADAITCGSIAFPPNIDRKRAHYAGVIRRARLLLGLSVEVNRDGLLDPEMEAFLELSQEPLTAESPV